MTFIRKDAHKNWRATDEIDLGNDRVLTITTSKNYSGNLNTNASVATKEGNFLTHVMYQDFSHTIFCRHPSRITSNVVEGQHGEAMAMLESIKSAVNAHYKIDESCCV